MGKQPAARLRCEGEERKGRRVGSTFRVLSFYGLGMNRRPSFRKASYTEQIAQLAAACDWLEIDRNRGEIPPAFRRGFGRVSLARAA
jgi:hypothetical protein